MIRVQPRTIAILAETVIIVVFAATFGWYYYHVQSLAGYTGDPLYSPNGYRTEWIIGTASNNVTSTVSYSSQPPTTNQTVPFSIEARMMNSYFSISFAPCARWLYQNTTGPRAPATCDAPAAMNMIIINSGVCLPSVPKPIVRESYNIQYHTPSNVLYESGNTTTPETTTVRFSVPTGDYCIITMDTGHTDLSVLMNAKVQFTTI